MSLLERRYCIVGSNKIDYKYYSILLSNWGDVEMDPGIRPFLFE